jgi:hypothetical protein
VPRAVTASATRYVITASDNRHAKEGCVSGLGRPRADADIDERDVERDVDGLHIYPMEAYTVSSDVPTP